MSAVMHDALQPGDPDELVQCVVRRRTLSAKATYRAIYTLSLALGSPPAVTEGKFLLAARKVSHLCGTEYLIYSVAVDDVMSSGSESSDVNVVGKLRSNFLGKNFTIYENQLLRHNGVNQALYLKVGQVDYEEIPLRYGGPRRMQCTLHTISASAIDDKRFARQVPAEDSVSGINVNDFFHSSTKSDSLATDSESMSTRLLGQDEPLVLKNKAPRWNEVDKCWGLNFQGRVTEMSVKNFQLVAPTAINQLSSQRSEHSALEPNQTSSKTDDKVLLQFGKIGDDMFTMEYRYPFSSFQAFAICLSQFC